MRFVILGTTETHPHQPGVGAARNLSVFLRSDPQPFLLLIVSRTATVQKHKQRGTVFRIGTERFFHGCNGSEGGGRVAGRRGDAGEQYRRDPLGPASSRWQKEEEAVAQQSYIRFGRRTAQCRLLHLHGNAIAQGGFHVGCPTSTTRSGMEAGVLSHLPRGLCTQEFFTLRCLPPVQREGVLVTFWLDKQLST